MNLQIHICINISDQTQVSDHWWKTRTPSPPGPSQSCILYLTTRITPTSLNNLSRLANLLKGHPPWGVFIMSTSQTKFKPGYVIIVDDLYSGPISKVNPSNQS